MHILLFIKAPRAGTVKTRLAKSLGDEKALEIYKKLVTRQLKNLPENAELEIHFSPPDAENEIREWLGENRKRIPQCEGDLGDRLDHAVRNAFSRGAGRVVCIGADCPGLNEKIFQQTNDALNAGADLVVGPTCDGGYYLIAMKKVHPDIFRQIPWSQSDTLNVTLERAEAAHLEVRLLEKLSDVDHEADWQKVRNLYDL